MQSLIAALMMLSVGRHGRMLAEGAERNRIAAGDKSDGLSCECTDAWSAERTDR